MKVDRWASAIFSPGFIDQCSVGVSGDTDEEKNVLAAWSNPLIRRAFLWPDELWLEDEDEE